MVTEIKQWGNSLALRIPRAFARETQLSNGAAVNLSVRAGRLVVAPCGGKKFRLADLAKKIRPSNLHAETWADAPRGKELW